MLIIITEHIGTVCSSQYKLFFISVCSVKILNIIDFVANTSLSKLEKFSTLLQRTYPAVYRTQYKLNLDLTNITPSQGDFDVAMKSIIPASVRSDSALAIPLAKEIKPLLDVQVLGF